MKRKERYVCTKNQEKRAFISICECMMTIVGVSKDIILLMVVEEENEMEVGLRRYIISSDCSKLWKLERLGSRRDWRVHGKEVEKGTKRYSGVFHQCLQTKLLFAGLTHMIYLMNHLWQKRVVNRLGML